MTEFVPILLDAAAFGLAAFLGVLVYTLLFDPTEPDPVLLPSHEDDTIPQNEVWVARVRYDQTGKHENFVVIADGRSKYEAKQAIQDQIRGADVTNMARERLYRFGPGADRDG